jgi:hypothetical protein
MSRPSDDQLNEILALFGAKAEDVQVMPERDPLELLPNGITDAELEQLGKSGTPAMRARLNDAAAGFNLQMMACGITVPWRRLLEDFRDDLECTTRLQPIMIDGHPLTLPGGTVQMVCVDSGKFPGDRAMREALWKLHEILEEIDDHESSAVTNGRKGGRDPQYDDEAIKQVIRSVLGESKAARMTNKWIIARVIGKLGSPEMAARINLNKRSNKLPGETKINDLLKQVRNEQK